MAKKTQKTGAGELTEELTILTSSPVARVIASITRVGAVVTVTTVLAHGFADGDYVTLAGVTPAEYVGEAQVDVTGATTFTFQTAASPASPATVPGTVMFTSDNQGGQGSGWYVLATVWGRMRPLSASELLAAKAINSTQTYEGKIYYRVPQDITPLMQVRWTPYGYPDPKTLEIHGVLPDEDEPRRFLILAVGEVL